MFTKSLLTTFLAIASVNGFSQGFNYGSTKSDNSAMMQADFQKQFQAAKSLPGTNGKFTSARLYTMIQAYSQNSPIQAIPAAIAEDVTLLLGLWASSPDINNELAALKSAITQYGDSFAKLVVGISVGSEDLYRNSPTGIEAGSTVGNNPQNIVDFINQVKSTVSGTGLANVPIGHVDTWTAWVNGSNSAVIEAVDWLGFDAYPYYQNTMPNNISDANALFWQAYDETNSVAGGKPVWVTETGWPISGPTQNLAIANVPTAEEYWNSVACETLGQYNIWWYTLDDDNSATPLNVTFGLVNNANLDAPLYDLSCKGQSTVRPSSSSPSASSSSTATQSAATAGSTFVVTSSSGTKPTGSTSSSSSASASGSSSSGNSSFAVSSKDLAGAMGLLSIQLATFIGAAVVTAFFAL